MKVEEQRLKEKVTEQDRKLQELEKTTRSKEEQMR